MIGGKPRRSAAQKMAVLTLAQWQTREGERARRGTAIATPLPPPPPRASGARIEATCFQAMQERQASFGLATMASAPARGIATIFEARVRKAERPKATARESLRCAAPR